jgi:tRNA(fMet)-specific endonuclease VapC
LRIIYDTNVLLQILRDDRSISRLQTIYNLYDVEESISLVTVAEIRSLSIQFRWGAIRRAKMEASILGLEVLDINMPEIIDRYVEIDCYSKGNYLTRASNFSAIKMGKNDLWIAATASVYECKLLTMDLDFGHLRDEFVDVVYITPSIFMS